MTPLQKVIQLMDEMVAKGKQEKHNEEVEFAKRQVLCDSVRTQKTKAIQSAADEMVQLSADIDKAASDATVLAGEIEELNSNVDGMRKELDSATAIRKKEHDDFAEQHRDLSESVDACKRAFQVIKARSADIKQSDSLLQVANLAPPDTRAMLESLIAMEGPPQPNAYEFQGARILDLIDKMRLKFEDQRLALEKEEMAAKANFEVLHQQLTDDTAAAESSIEQKTAMKAERQQDEATAKNDLAETTAQKADDENMLSNSLADCDAASKEYEQNQVTRAAEIEALQKAAGILQSGAVAGNAEKHLPSASFLQQHTVAQALVQMKNEPQTEIPLRERLVDLLQGAAKRSGSRYLTVMATHAADDPFAKVKKMIKDLIVKLMEQANSEADHHAYCTTELSTNKQTRDNKASEVEELSSKIDELTALSTTLTSEMEELSDSVAELKADMAESTNLRIEDKQTNAKTIEDAKEAQLAVEEAIKVLEGFYGKSASFLQGGESAPYTGMSSESGGVFGLLEVILSDFARLEAETTSADSQAETAHGKFMDESSESIAVKDTALKHKESKRQQTEEKMRNLKKERTLTQEELDAALNYYDKLKADCLDKGLSYEERKQAREEEIQSLKEALQMLSAQDLA